VALAFYPAKSRRFAEKERIRFGASVAHPADGPACRKVDSFSASDVSKSAYKKAAPVKEAAISNLFSNKLLCPVMAVFNIAHADMGEVFI